MNAGRPLAGRAALVVGGGQAAGETLGNGRAVAIELGRRGARVVVADRDESSAAATVEMLRSEGGEAWTVAADIAVQDDCERLAARAEELTGGVDVLHNNVGIMMGGTSSELTIEQWRRSFDVNLTGTWMMCRAVLPGMRERGAGAVVNVSSLASLTAGPRTIAYSVSKAAVNAMTRALALENAPHGVRVNAVLPGLIDTPMGVDAPAAASGLDRADVARRRAAMAPMGMQGTAWDIARASAFLAGDDARFITGVLLPVDGGSSLQSGTAGAPWLAPNGPDDPRGR
jgi:NAD(P)-dependent dehydrogenase (short-subunit alcohol dehydrogenase family)